MHVEPPMNAIHFLESDPSNCDQGSCHLTAFLSSGFSSPSFFGSSFSFSLLLDKVMALMTYLGRLVALPHVSDDLSGKTRSTAIDANGRQGPPP
jgi:hypothetical protein